MPLLAELLIFFYHHSFRRLQSCGAKTFDNRLAKGHVQLYTRLELRHYY